MVTIQDLQAEKTKILDHLDHFKNRGHLSIGTLREDLKQELQQVEAKIKLLGGL